MEVQVEFKIKVMERARSLVIDVSDKKDSLVFYVLKFIFS